MLAPTSTHGLTHATPCASRAARPSLAAFGHLRPLSGALTVCQADGVPDPERVVSALRKERGSRAYGIREGFTVTSVAPRSGNPANGLVLTYTNPKGKVRVSIAELA